MLIHIPKSNKRFGGTVPIGINGVISKIPIGVDFDATDAQIAALVAADIPTSDYSPPAGFIVIPMSRYGSRLPVGVNGSIIYLPTGIPIQPATDVVEALDKAGVAYLGGVSTSSASIISDSAFTQPGASQRFYQAKANAPGTWSKGSGGNAADFTINATTGIWSINDGAGGDGSAQIVKTFPIIFTPSSGGAAATQTITLTLATVSPPGSLSESYQADLTGVANTKLHSLPGWALYGVLPAATEPFLDGAGHLTGTNDYDDKGGQWAVLYSPSALGGGKIKYGLRKAASNNQSVRMFIAVSDALNGLLVQGQENTGDVNFQPGAVFRQAGTYGSNLGNPFSPSYAAYLPDGTLEVSFEFTADGNTVNMKMVGADWTSTGTIDLTGKTKGPKFGFSAAGQYGPAMAAGALIDSISYVRAATTLTVTDAPVRAPANVVTYTLAWGLTKPTRLQHRFRNRATNAVVTPWMTGETLTNTGTTSGTITYQATAPSGDILVAEFRALNDTEVVATAPNGTAFLNSMSAEFGFNIVGENYFYSTNFENDWGKSVEIRDANAQSAILISQAGITGFANIQTIPGVTLAAYNVGENTVSVISSNPTTGQHRVQITGDAANTRGLMWSGTKPTYLTVTRDGMSQDGYNPLAVAGLVGKYMRNLDLGVQNYEPLVGLGNYPSATDKLYQVNATGSNVPIERQLGFIAAKMAADPTFKGFWDVVPATITDAQMTARATAWRDILPATAKIVFEYANETPWNQAQFTGARRLILDAWRNGHYGTGTFASPAAPLDVIGESAYLDPNNPQATAPAMTTGQCLEVPYGGIGPTCFKAKQNVPAGTIIGENAYFTRVVGTEDWIDAGHRWKAVRMNQLLAIIASVFGAARYAAQIEPAIMGQAGGGILGQTSVEKNYVPGLWSKIKRLGFSFYFYDSDGQDWANATIASVKASLYAEMPAKKAQMRELCLDVLSQGMIPSFYEGMTHPHFTEYQNYPAYQAAWDGFMNSDDGAEYMRQIGAFMKTLPGLAMGYTLISARPWCLTTKWSDTSSKRYIGYMQGIA